VVVADPGARTETEDHVAREAARGGKVDVFEAGRIPELGVVQPLREPPLLARGPLLVDQEPETVLEAQLGVLTRAALLVESLRHRR
jgi:hypothetical protein